MKHVCVKIQIQVHNGRRGAEITDLITLAWRHTFIPTSFS